MTSIDAVIAHVRKDPALFPTYAIHLTAFAATHVRAASITTHPETSRIATRMAADCAALAANGEPDTFSRRMQAFLAASRTLDLPRDERNRLCLADDEARACAAA